jgi:hypothetical protein
MATWELLVAQRKPHLYTWQEWRGTMWDSVWQSVTKQTMMEMAIAKHRYTKQANYWSPCGGYQQWVSKAQLLLTDYFNPPTAATHLNGVPLIHAAICSFHRVLDQVIGDGAHQVVRR